MQQKKRGLYLFEIIIMLSLILMLSVQLVPYSKNQTVQNRQDLLDSYADAFYRHAWNYWCDVKAHGTEEEILEANRQITCLGSTEPFDPLHTQGMNLSYSPDILKPPFRAVIGLTYRGYIYITYTLDENGLLSDITHVYYAKKVLSTPDIQIGTFPAA